MPLSNLMQGFGKAEGGSRKWVLIAYEYPLYSSPAMQERAGRDFQNQVELDCYKKAK